MSIWRKMVNFKLSKEVFSDFIGFLPEIKKWILEILAILYILGMIIVAQYLKEFNISVRKFPVNLIAGFMKMGERPTFEAEAAAQKAPTVNF